MKLSKEELKKRIDEVIEDDDLKISLLEDIEDSIDVSEEETVEKSAYEDLKAKYEELKEKYKDRFLKGEEKEEVEEKEEDIEEVKEEEVIDVQEI